MADDDQLKLRADRIAWRRLGDEMVVLDLTTSTYLSTNASATMLWQALEQGTTREALVTALTERYGIDAGQAGGDVDTFLADARGRDLLA